MVLGLDKVLALINDPDIRLISNTGARELQKPEGSTIDLRLGALYRLQAEEIGSIENDSYNGSTLELGRRRTPNVDLLLRFDSTRPSSEQAVCMVEPGDYFLVETIEQFRMPHDLRGIVYTRTTLFRQGIALLCSVVAPGYGLLSEDENGATLTFGLKNIGNCKVELQMGARIAQIEFDRIEGLGQPYRGQWQQGRGRVSTDRERQE